MKDHVVSPIYRDSGESIRVGDQILIDDNPATVEGVFLPRTQAAEDCYCEDTGALSVLYDDGVPVLIPFGNYHTVSKRA